MSYTPHTWENDELITAAKMNNIEEGVQEAGELPKGFGLVTFDITTTNFPTGREASVGYFWYAWLEDGGYEPARVFASLMPVWVTGNVSHLVYYSPFPVPAREDLYLIFVVSSVAEVTNHSGGISEPPVSVTGHGQAYIITGDFSIEFRYY